MYQNSYKRKQFDIWNLLQNNCGAGVVRRGEGYTRSKMGHNLMFVETGKSVPDFTVLASLLPYILGVFHKKKLNKQMKSFKEIVRDNTAVANWNQLYFYFIFFLYFLLPTLNRPVVAKGGVGGGGMDWEVGTSRSKLLYQQWIINKVLLYSAGNYTQYPVINHNGK